MSTQARQTMRTRRLGAELRRLRRESGLTQSAAVATLDADRSGLSNIECGKACPSRRTLAQLLDRYGVTDEDTRSGLIALRDAAAARTSGGYIPETYQEYISCEDRAAHLAFFELSLIPGPLQVPEYVREQARCGLPDATSEEIHHRVSVRLDRQERLLSRGATLDVVLSEAALMCAVGGPEVMIDQLRHLIGLRESPNVSIRVLPFSVGAHGSMSSAFVILDFPKEPAVVALESPFGELFQEDMGEIARFRELWASLQGIALDPDESAELMSAAMDFHERQR